MNMSCRRRGESSFLLRIVRNEGEYQTIAILGDWRLEGMKNVSHHFSSGLNVLRIVKNELSKWVRVKVRHLFE